MVVSHAIMAAEEREALRSMVWLLLPLFLPPLLSLTLFLLGHCILQLADEHRNALSVLLELS